MAINKESIELLSFLEFALTSNKVKSKKEISTHLLLTVMGHFGATKGEVFLYDGEQRYHKGKCQEECRFEEFPLNFSNQKLGTLKFEIKKDLSSKDRHFVQSLCSLTSAFLKNTQSIDDLKKANRNLSRKILQIDSVFEISRELLLLKDIRDAALLCLNVLAGQLLIKELIIAIKNRQDSYELFCRGCSPEKIIMTREELEENPVLETVIEISDRITVMVGNKFNKKPVEKADRDFISILLNFLTVSVENIYMIEDLIEKEKIAREVKIASDIQQRLLPQEIPVQGRVTFFPKMLTFSDVGGDYYDMIELNEQEILFLIADVTGKGVPAALIMSAAQSSLRSIIIHGERDLIEIISNTNKLLAQTTEGNKFLSFFAGIVNTETGHLEYVNAGHNPPILINMDSGDYDLLTTGGMVLGIFEDALYSTGEVQLKQNDTLFMYTDGLTEAVDINNEEFGEENVIDTLRKGGNDSCDQLIQTMVDTVNTYSSGLFNDDLTMLCMKFS